MASVDAFIAAADANPDAGSIQVGTYSLMEQMKASDAARGPGRPRNIVTTDGHHPRGPAGRGHRRPARRRAPTSAQQVQPGARRPRGHRPARLRRRQPRGLPLPRDLRLRARRHSPSTCSPRWSTGGARPPTPPTSRVPPHRSASPPHELMTVASIVEAEGRGDDIPKIARVIYNRLGRANPAAGCLQIDATVSTTPCDRERRRADHRRARLESDSPYNTYQQQGLPPGPIEAPGDAADQGGAQPRRRATGSST